MMLKYGLAFLTVAAFTMPQQYPGWQSNTTYAFNEARRTGKPLFVVFR